MIRMTLLSLILFGKVCNCFWLPVTDLSLYQLQIIIETTILFYLFIFSLLSEDGSSRPNQSVLNRKTIDSKEISLIQNQHFVFYLTESPLLDLHRSKHSY